jgi:phosphatidylserine/phosphatidylglycerophosphate/cardiolipin synthase-like enzyme
MQFIDSNQDGVVSETESQARDAIAQLRNARIPILDDRADGSKGSGLMHHKFVVVDGKVIVTGSANFTVSDIHQEYGEPESRGNVNHLLRIESPTLAQLFTEEFNILWGDGPGGKPNSIFGVKKPLRPTRTVLLGDRLSNAPAASVSSSQSGNSPKNVSNNGPNNAPSNARITIQFSPSGKRQPWSESSNGLIVQAVAQATQQIDLALFVFSEQKIADTLELSRKRGVNLRALIDPGFAFRPYSEALDMMGHSLTQACKTEKDNRPWKQPLDSVGVPKLLPGDSLHHKFAVLDRRAVITGSHNWSKAANDQNDETLMIIDSPIVAAHFQREFERLYRDAVLGLPVFAQKKMAAETQNCR